MGANDASITADRSHVFHSWSAQAALAPTPVAGGAGCEFWDHEGTRYLDFSSQLVNLNLGHQHPVLVDAIIEQARTLCTIAPSFANDTRSEAARLIAERAPGTLSKVFFTNGGAEANENAVRLARHHTGRQKVLAAYRSYHGATAGAASLTGEPRRWGSEPAVPGVVHFFSPYLYRSAFAATTPREETERSLNHLADVIAMEGPHQIAAIIIETIVGTNGVLIPPDGYLQGVRELCDQHGIMLICDEVMVGFGRVGQWFAIQHWNVEPDLITFAKGVNSGYVPLGGVVMTEEIAQSFAHVAYPGGLTYSGHPLACAVAVAAIGVMASDGFMERVRDIGERIIGPALTAMTTRHPSIGEVRGLGAFWAIELVRDRTTKEPLVPFNASGGATRPMQEVTAACKQRGVWPISHFNRLQLAPPLVISDNELERGLAVIDDALDAADAYVYQA